MGNLWSCSGDYFRLTQSPLSREVDPSLRVTLDDLAEVKPDFARMLRNSA